MNRTRGFLKTHKTSIIQDRTRVVLRGINLGGWLMMEGYILHAPNLAHHLFKEEFIRRRGRRAYRQLIHGFRENFVTEQDLRWIARKGFNCVRVPFHYQLVWPFQAKRPARSVTYLDRVIRWAKKVGLWVILDLHATCGCQNHDWHSDSAGAAQLWDQKKYQRHTYAVWEFLADRYRTESNVAGYDLLNEPVTHNTKVLNDFYQCLVRVIRRADKRHILFVEGNHWARDLKVLQPIEDDNTAFSIHFYDPLEFTCNFVPHQRYPQRRGFNRKTLRRILEPYRTFARRRQRPVFVGEFGVNYRQGHDGEDRWVSDVTGCFRELGFHWTYWTYKAVKNSIFPDGLFSYYPNPPWVHRHGPYTGWQNYAVLWPTRQKDMIRSWRTEHFCENQKITRVLKQAASAP